VGGVNYNLFESMDLKRGEHGGISREERVSRGMEKEECGERMTLRITLPPI